MNSDGTCKPNPIHGFNDEMIHRHDLPQDAFELIHDLCYHIASRDVIDYVRRAQKILKRKTFKLRVPLDLAKLMAEEDQEAAQEFVMQGAKALGKLGGRVGGKSKSPAKQAASRANGKKHTAGKPEEPKPQDSP